jgi:hypothetical protein
MDSSPHGKVLWSRRHYRKHLSLRVSERIKKFIWQMSIDGENGHNELSGLAILSRIKSSAISGQGSGQPSCFDA